MEFITRCALRREELPMIACDCSKCDWYIRDPQSENCFWVLAKHMDDFPGNGLSVEEIATLEGLSVEEVEKLLESALKKTRETCAGNLLRTIED